MDRSNPEEIPLQHKQGEKKVADLTQEELLLHSITYFHESLEKRADMISTNARWTNLVIRSGMSGLMLVAVSILVLVVMVAKQLNQVADVMVTLDQKMEVIVNDIGQMEHYVDAIGTNVATMPDIVHEIAIMQQSVAELDDHMSEISAQMSQTEMIVDDVVQDIEQMDQHLGAVNHIVKGRPFRFFNDMVPMP
jgi:uncharacterized protein YoxC